MRVVRAKWTFLFAAEFIVSKGTPQEGRPLKNSSSANIQKDFLSRGLRNCTVMSCPLEAAAAACWTLLLHEGFCQSSNALGPGKREAIEVVPPLAKGERCCHHQFLSITYSYGLAQDDREAKVWQWNAGIDLYRWKTDNLGCCMYCARSSPF